MQYEDLSFPKGFCDIGLISFKDLYDRKKEFVDFTLKDMENPSGLFLKWKQFCLEKVKNNAKRD